MSATGRGADRQPDDHYRTPLWPVELIAPELPRTGDILDPGCGGGAILQHLRAQGFDESKMYGVELREERALEARIALPKARIKTADFLTPIVGPVAHPFALSAFNPPYTQALEFVQQSLAYTTPIGGTTAALLRLNWLGSQARAKFHQTFPCDVYVLDERPEFVASIKCKNKKKGCAYQEILPIEASRPKICPTCGAGVSVTTTDATEYAWMLWGPGRGNRWFVLSKPKKIVVPKAISASVTACDWCGKPSAQCRNLGLPGCDPKGGVLRTEPPASPILAAMCMTCREVPVEAGAPKRCARCEAFAISDDPEDVVTPFSGRDLDLLPQVMFKPGPNPFGVPSDILSDAFCNLCFGAQYATPEGAMCIYLHKTLPILREYKPAHARWCSECQKVVHESVGCDHHPAGELIVPGCAACEKGIVYGGDEDFKHTGTGSYCKEPSRPRVTTGDMEERLHAEGADAQKDTKGQTPRPGKADDEASSANDKSSVRDSERTVNESPRPGKMDDESLPSPRPELSTGDRATTVSKRRGRPPGSKNKKKQASVDAWDLAEHAAAWAAAEEVASKEVRRQQKDHLETVIAISLEI